MEDKEKNIQVEEQEDKYTEQKPTISPNKDFYFVW